MRNCWLLLTLLVLCLPGVEPSRDELLEGVSDLQREVLERLKQSEEKESSDLRRVLEALQGLATEVQGGAVGECVIREGSVLLSPLLTRIVVGLSLLQGSVH